MSGCAVSCLARGGHLLARSVGTPSRSPKQLYIIPVLLAITACTTTPVAVCPPLKEYPESFSNLLANEIEAMPADSATVVAIGDYIALRDAVRACRGE